MKKNYKGQDHRGTGGSGVLPEGDYILKIFGDEWKKTASGGHMLSLEMVGADKESGKKHIWDNINLDCPTSEKAEEIAGETIEKIVFCCLGSDGEISFGKTPTLKPLHGMKIGVHLEVESPTKKELKKNPTWKEKNIVRYYFPADESDGLKDEKKDKKKGKKSKSKDVPF